MKSLFKTMKNYKKYIVLSLVYLLIMIICMFLETNILTLLFHFFSNNTYRDKIMNIYNDYNLIACFIKLIYNLFSNFEWSIDYIIIWSTNIFQFSLPFVAILGFLWEEESKKSHNMMISIKCATKMASSTFIAYIIFYLLVIIICRGHFSTYISRSFLCDIFGKSFYYNHAYVYYLIDGFVKFFLMTFIYSYCGSLMSVSLNNESKIYFCYYLPIIYFCFSIISTLLVYVIGDISMYLSPLTIMIAGSYFNISTPIIILVNFIPALICSLIYHMKMSKLIN